MNMRRVAALGLLLSGAVACGRGVGALSDPSALPSLGPVDEAQQIELGGVHLECEDASRAGMTHVDFGYPFEGSSDSPEAAFAARMRWSRSGVRYEDLQPQGAPGPDGEPSGLVGYVVDERVLALFSVVGSNESSYGMGSEAICGEVVHLFADMREAECRPDDLGLQRATWVDGAGGGSPSAEEALDAFFAAANSDLTHLDFREIDREAPPGPARVRWVYERGGRTFVSLSTYESDGTYRSDGWYATDAQGCGFEVFDDPGPEISAYDIPLTHDLQCEQGAGGSDDFGSGRAYEIPSRGEAETYAIAHLSERGSPLLVEDLVETVRERGTQWVVHRRDHRNVVAVQVFADQSHGRVLRVDWCSEATDVVPPDPGDRGDLNEHGYPYLACGAPPNETNRDGFVDDGGGPRRAQDALYEEIRGRQLQVEGYEFLRVRRSGSDIWYVYIKDGRRLAAFEMIKLDRGSWAVQTIIWCDEVDHIFGNGG
jgi:hypothetical protein